MVRHQELYNWYWHVARQVGLRLRVLAGSPQLVIKGMDELSLTLQQFQMVVLLI